MLTSAIRVLARMGLAKIYQDLSSASARLVSERAILVLASVKLRLSTYHCSI